jgi:2',3'-cyclic-nucleotide 2'-phosphodiesterase
MSKVKKGGALRVLFIGDVVGRPGIEVCQRQISKLKNELDLDTVVINGENSAPSGKGINDKTADALFAAGADIITTGNHVWRAKEFRLRLDRSDNIVRPANYPTSCPGKGYAFLSVAGTQIAFLNIQGRVFFRETLDCPFKTAETQLLFLKSRAKIVFVDFHAEATSEKAAMGYYLDGKVSGIVGTHTHVQTADERILPKGTGFISDLGCCGALNASLGVKPAPVLNMFLTQMPHKFEVEEEPPFVLSGVFMDVDQQTGKCVYIERVRIID